mgnify:CR=1 FL=1|tara:strand:- start:572 stop:706 length:135 start_codon:yes stop_codon:yes gene_type:complete
MDLVLEKINKAKQVLNLSDDEFKGICLAVEEMKNKEKVNHNQTE